MDWSFPELWSLFQARSAGRRPQKQKHLPIERRGLDVTESAGFAAAEEEDVRLRGEPSALESFHTSLGERNMSTHGNTLIILQLDDVAHLNILPLLILQA